MKDLLEQVMPEFSPVPDRVEQVRRRARAARERLLWTGSAAAVLVVAAGAGVVAAQTSPDQLAVAGASATCEPAKGRPVYIGTGPLNVPVDAAKVTMCIFPDPIPGLPPPPVGHGVVPLTGSPAVPQPPRPWDLVGTKVQQDTDGAIGRKINAMPKPGACATPSGNYKLVFEFENRDLVFIQLHDRCGDRIPREELLRGGDVLGWLDRMGEPYPMIELVQRR